MSRLLLIGAACVLLLPVLVISAATGGIAVAAPTETAATTIPPEYLALYEQAGIASGLPWQLLAGVGKVECDHGRNPDPACWKQGVENKAGAGGPMQFLASTWATYGLDADNDGQADRWDPVDAIFSAANYLKASGAPGNDESALYAYNHSQAYVQEVLAWAGLYAEAGPGSSTDTTAATTPNLGAASGASSAAQAAVAYALAQLGTPYRWGGDEPGGFDCSGLVQAAYAAAGIQLPRTAQAQYDATTPLPAGAPLVPGDLVFFGSDTAHITHVGIVADNQGDMVDAPHSGAVVRIESAAWPDYVGATLPVSAQGQGQ